MLCQACKEKTATIHLTELTDGQRCETHLCQQCAESQGLAIKSQIPLNELLNTLLSAGPQATDTSENTPSQLQSEHPCPDCGMTLKRFSKESQLGCPHDYEEFETELTPLIEQTQNGQTRHVGKVPSRMPAQHHKNVERKNLQRQLDAAVKNEDYETAAKLRDQIESAQ